MELIPISDIQTMALNISKSGFFGLKTPEQAAALMLVAQADGLHPAKAATHYHIIQGKPSLSADAMLARFQSAGGRVNWDTYTDAEVTGTFSHAQGGSVKISWTIARAKKAAIGNLEKFPAAMLRARCISEGIRTVYPGVIVGMYTPEEVQTYAPSVTESLPAPTDWLLKIEQTTTLQELTAVFFKAVKSLDKNSTEYTSLQEAAATQKLILTHDQVQTDGE
jgi:hypothetical protein